MHNAIPNVLSTLRKTQYFGYWEKITNCAGWKEGRVQNDILERRLRLSWGLKYGYPGIYRDRVREQNKGSEDLDNPELCTVLA